MVEGRRPAVLLVHAGKYLLGAGVLAVGQVRPAQQVVGLGGQRVPGVGVEEAFEVPGRLLVLAVAQVDHGARVRLFRGFALVQLRQGFQSPVMGRIDPNQLQPLLAGRGAIPAGVVDPGLQIENLRGQVGQVSLELPIGLQGLLVGSGLRVQSGQVHGHRIDQDAVLRSDQEVFVRAGGGFALAHVFQGAGHPEAAVVLQYRKRALQLTEVFVRALWSAQEVLTGCLLKPLFFPLSLVQALLVGTLQQTIGLLVPALGDEFDDLFIPRQGGVVCDSEQDKVHQKGQ